MLMPNQDLTSHTPPEVITLTDAKQLYARRPGNTMLNMSQLVKDGKCPACNRQLESEAYCDLCGWTFVMRQSDLEILMAEVWNHAETKDTE